MNNQPDGDSIMKAIKLTACGPSRACASTAAAWLLVFSLDVASVCRAVQAGDFLKAVNSFGTHLIKNHCDDLSAELVLATGI